MQDDYSPIQFDNAYQRHVHRTTYPARKRIASALQAELDLQPFERVVIDPCNASKLLTKLQGCCKYPQIVRHTVTGDLHVSEARCRSRICPRCGNVRTRELRVRLDRLVKLIDSPRMLTLTLASSNEPLSVQLKRLAECFRGLRRRQAWKSKIKGGLYVIEITWNHARHQWHPHIHALIDGEYWRQSDIADEWQAVTGDSRIVDIRMVYGREAAIGYVVKYVSKSQLSDKIPTARILEWAENTHGARMVGTFGSLHGAKTAESGEDDEGGYESLVPFEAVMEASNHGDAVAKQFIEDYRIIKRRRLPDGTPLDDTEYQQLCGQAADSIRAWWASKQEVRSGHDPPERKSNRRRNSTDQRTERLWQESDLIGSNESVTPG